jgi:hypothetical protein
MKRILLVLALATAPLALSACVERGHTRVGVGYTWYSYPYSVWYDGYYGPFYDGYWGTDGYFYFRLTSRDPVYRRADTRHVYRERPRVADRYRFYEGQTRRPPDGTRMPNYPGNRDRNRDPRR